MYGDFRFGRPYWFCRDCGHSEYPGDKRYGIDKLDHRITKAVELEAVYFAQNQMSFDKAAEVLKRVYGLDINRETIRELAETAGTQVFVHDTERAEHTMENIQNIGEDERKKGTVYVMMDGAAVNTRVEDENGSTWRENKTVIAFSSREMIQRKDGGNIITHKEIAPLIGSSEDFKKHVLDVAVRAGYGLYENTVVIADGATWIRNMCEEIFPDAIQILDLYHLKENIHTFSKHIHGQDLVKAREWAEMIIGKVEKGLPVEEILSCIPKVENLPAGIPNIKIYIENNSEKINYPSYREQGFFVGSGAIESSNKTIVQQRLKRAGMRWSVAGAQALLSLRAKEESDRWREVEQICA